MLEESPCPKVISRCNALVGRIYPEDRFILRVMGLDLLIFELVVHEQVF